MQYLEKHGEITPAIYCEEIAPRISRRVAHKDLRGLVERGLVIRVGHTRRTRYVLPSSEYRDIQTFALFLDAQPPEVQEAFQFLLATAMHEAGKFELLNVAEVDGRWHYTFSGARRGVQCDAARS